MGEGCKLTIDRDLPIEIKRRIFGGFLRAAREGREKSLTELVHLTRISPNFVMALENGDFDALPGRVFGRGFIKNLCVALDVPSQELIDIYDLCWEDEPTRFESSALQRAKSARRAASRQWLFRPVSLGFAAVVFIGIGSWLWQFSTSNDEVTAELTPAGSAEQAQETSENNHGSEAVVLEPRVSNPTKTVVAEVKKRVEKKNQAILEVAKVAPDIEQTPTYDGGVLEVLVLEPVAVTVSLDKASSVRKELKLGKEILEFQENLSIVLEDASKVQLIFQGKNLGALGPGERKLSFSFASKPIYASQKP